MRGGRKQEKGLGKKMKMQINGELLRDNNFLFTDRFIIDYDDVIRGDGFNVTGITFPIVA